MATETMPDLHTIGTLAALRKEHIGLMTGWTHPGSPEAEA